jgi:hypothetical protein
MLIARESVCDRWRASGMYLSLRYAIKSRAGQHDAKLVLHSSFYLLPKKLYLLIGSMNRRRVGKRVALAKSELLYRSSANSGGSGHVGPNWLPRYLQRWQHLQTKLGRGIDALRVQSI